MKFVKISCLENFCLYSSCATLEKIDPQEGCLWLAQIYFLKRCKEEMSRKWDTFQEHISRELVCLFSSNLVCTYGHVYGGLNTR